MVSQLEIRQQVESFEGAFEPAITQAIHNTARAMVETSLKVQAGQKVLIWFDGPGLPLVKEMYHACMAKGAQVSFHRRDYEADAVEIAQMTPDEIRAKFVEEKRLVDESDAILLVRNPENPLAMDTLPPELRSAYNQGRSEAHHRRLIDLKDGGVNWCLFIWPTQYEADKEGLSLPEYQKAYFEACNQPWEAIKKAQGKLKEKLDRANRITLIANENEKDPMKRTHLSMSIEGMTFINSSIEKNYPGSEVFSAPVIDSVEGQVYADGEYIYDGHLMKNIYLKFEKGQVVEARAEEGNVGLQEILAQGKGARYLGEIALGTNPGLRRRFFNDLLNEKVGGSFHIAVGHCYEYKEADGQPVNVNNGNLEGEPPDKTPNHWDLTILMHKGGRVILDEEVIQENGIFLDPELAVLNPPN